MTTTAIPATNDALADAVRRLRTAVNSKTIIKDMAPWGRQIRLIEALYEDKRPFVLDHVRSIDTPWVWAVETADALLPMVTTNKEYELYEIARGLADALDHTRHYSDEQWADAHHDFLCTCVCMAHSGAAAAAFSRPLRHPRGPANGGGPRRTSA